MKKYLFIAVITGCITSCTTDSSEKVLPQSKTTEVTYFSPTGKIADSLDTGGQGSSTPIKPPKP